MGKITQAERQRELLGEGDESTQADWYNAYRSHLEQYYDQVVQQELAAAELDCSKAHTKLGWRPIWNDTKMLKKTVQWYREFYESDHVLSQEQLTAYTDDAKEQGISWAMT